MASFTDQVQTFNPYIKQIPVEEYAKAELIRQEQYDKGVQQVQQYMDTVAGLPVDGKYKGYLQESLSQLQGHVSEIAEADFSNMQIVNQVGGAVKQIAGDKIIQAGIISAANYKAGLDQMKKDESEGKLTPDNAWFFTNKQYGEWSKNADLSQAFNGSYIKNYDIDKDIQEAIKAAHADGAEWEEIPKNADGTPNSDVLIQMSKKGLLSGKVANIIHSVLSKPQVQQQLQISGLYTFKDYDSQALKELQDKSLTYYRDKAENLIKDLKVKAAVSKEEKLRAGKGIEDIEKQLQEKEADYNDFMKLLMTNPESAKVQLYRQNFISERISNLSWEENSSKQVKSPAAEMQFQRLNYHLAESKERFDEFDANRKFALSQQEFGLKVEEMKIKKDIAEGKLNADGSPKVIYDKSAIDVNTIVTGSTAYQQETKDIEDQKTQLQAKLITNLPIEGRDIFVFNPDTKKYEYNTAKYPTWAEIKPIYQRAIKQLEESHLKGDVANNLKETAQQWYDLTSLAFQRRQKEAEIESKYKPQIQKLNKEYGKNIDPHILDYWTVQNGAPGAEAAKKRLQAMPNYGEFVDEITIPQGRGFGATERSGKRYTEYQGISKFLSKNNTLIPVLRAREEEYVKMQTQTKHYTGTFNPNTEKDRDAVNTVYSSVVSNLMGDKSKGDWETVAEWLDPKKPANLNANQYKFYKGEDGQNYLQVVRNTGSGFKTSKPIPVNQEIIDQMNLNENPKQKAFGNTFGGFLNTNQGLGTTRDFKSEEANNTAIARTRIGKYSVGVHLQAMDDGYVPHLYIKDVKTGTTLGKGIELDPSLFARDKSLNPEQQAKVAQLKSIMKDVDVLDQIAKLDEHMIDFLLSQQK